MSETITPNIGEFKPKRKYLSFVSATSNRFRLIRESAFIKGDKLSGLFKDCVFKITICDEGINFEEQDTNLFDKSMILNIIDDIDSMPAMPYAQKFIVGGIEFYDVDGYICYLEVDSIKPYDKLKSFFDEEVTPTISEKGLSLLDQLFGDDVEVDIIEEVKIENPTIKDSKSSFLEEQFSKIKESKIAELQSRIEQTEKNITKYKLDITSFESRLENEVKELDLLYNRIEGIKPNDEPNGYVFNVSSEQEFDIELDDNTKQIASKISDIIKIKKDILFKYLTEKYYTIKIAKKDDIENSDFKIDKDIYNKINSIVPMWDVKGSGIKLLDDNSFEYRGELNWHQLVSKMIRFGFEQDVEFEKLCNSNSYSIDKND